MRILMRAQMQHDKIYSHNEVFIGNLMGGNSGNWLYQFSLYRTLMYDESVKIDIVDFKKIGITNEYINSVNSNYDVFVLPFANAFKKSFHDELVKITYFVSRLKIPIVVPGIGIQSALGKDFNNGYEDKELAKKLIDEILKRSSCIGVRGESTASFFESLGYKREKDFTIIGCPSMYMHGAYLPKPKGKPDIKKSYVLTSKVEHENKKIVSLMKGFISENNNYTYIPQRLGDIIRCYYGADYRRNYISEMPPRFFDDRKTASFTSVSAWIDFIRENAEFSVGTRLHGNVAAVLAGVPAFIIATDKRVQELAEYHNISYTTVDKIPENGINLEKLFENYDPQKILEGHEERFNHFVDFLERNGLKTAYSENRKVKEVYFDTLLKEMNTSFDWRGFVLISEEEKLRRTFESAVFYADILKEKNVELKKKDERISELEKKLLNDNYVNNMSFKSLIKIIIKYFKSRFGFSLKRKKKIKNLS